ncbi:hypothetical protein V2W30_30115 [Streptomyces sp. Q6]|uniref:Uncharacterized protein n=1 Tax=Streptomyces citrinus TaxID=3118173 RepID=A0ACD5AJ16_9ACTN
MTRRQPAVLAVGVAATPVAVMDSFLVNVAVPSLRDDLQVDCAQVELVVGGIALFSLSSLGAGPAPASWPLIAFRVIQAVGAALFYPQVLAVMRDSLRGRAQTRPSRCPAP